MNRSKSAQEGQKMSTSSAPYDVHLGFLASAPTDFAMALTEGSSFWWGTPEALRRSKKRKALDVAKWNALILNDESCCCG